jgi:hypothetical protein
VIETEGEPFPWRGEAITWQSIESAIAADAEAYVASRFEASYDARGVDTTQIDRMLDLSPLERLQQLDEQRRGLAALRGDGPLE